MFFDLDQHGLLVGLDANIMHDMYTCMIHRLQKQNSFMGLIYVYFVSGFYAGCPL